MSTQNRSLYDRINEWMKKSITLRLITIVILTFIFMIPLSRVKDLIREREWRNEEAKLEVSEKWGGGQNICGPILTIPFWKNFNYYNNQSEKYEVRKEKKFAHFLPEELNINAQAEPQIRNRGIFEIILYESQVNLTGQFSKPQPYRSAYLTSVVSRKVLEPRLVKNNMNSNRASDLNNS